MKFETFNPQNYKSIEEMPAPLQKNFEETSDKTGFIRKETLQADQEALRKADNREKSTDESLTQQEKIKPIDISQEEALKEHRAIEEKYQSKIIELETGLGDLSEETKAKIYQEILAKHKDEIITHEENKIKTEEQAVYKNELVLQKAQEISILSEEQLFKIPESERLDLINQLSWDTFANNESSKYPEEVLDAISKIYKTYSPSEKLQLAHQKANEKALAALGDAELFNMEKKWDQSDQKENMKICEKWVQSLCQGYSIPNIVIEYLPRDSHAAAKYTLGGNPKDLGTIALYGDINYSSLNQIFSRLSHEVGHAFQEAMEKNIIDGQPYQRDIQWFSASKKWDEKESDKKSFQAPYERYHSLPKENDAHLLQGWVSEKINQNLESYKSKKLNETNLPDMETINLQEKISNWANNFLLSGEEIDGDTLVEIAQEKLKNKGPALIEQWFKGKTREESQQVIKNLFETTARAREILETTK